VLVAQARLPRETARFERHAFGIEPADRFRLERGEGRGDPVEIVMRRPFRGRCARIPSLSSRSAAREPTTPPEPAAPARS
jgi:hypothetical protein